MAGSKKEKLVYKSVKCKLGDYLETMDEISESDGYDSEKEVHTISREGKELVYITHVKIVVPELGICIRPGCYGYNDSDGFEAYESIYAVYDIKEKRYKSYIFWTGDDIWGTVICYAHDELGKNMTFEEIDDLDCEIFY